MSNHITTTCITCGGDICLHPEVHRSLLRTGDTFYCPAGHGQVFTKRPTPEEKRIKELEEQLERTERFYREINDDLYVAREELVGVVKECPFGCGWRSRRQIPRDPVAMGRGIERVRQDIAAHLVDEHAARGETIRLIPERTGAAL